MKKLAVLLICLFFLLLFVGCQQTDPPPVEPITESSSEVPSITMGNPSESESTEPDPTESTQIPTEEEHKIYLPETLQQPYVMDLYRDSYTSEEGRVYFDAIPYLCLPGTETEEINRNIQELCHYSPNMNEFAAEGGQFSYTFHTNGNILTLLLLEDYYSYQNYYIYNINLETCTLMTDTEVLAAAEIDWEEFNNKLPLLVGNRLMEKLQMADCETFGHLGWGYLEMLSDTTGYLLNYASPYLDENGDLAFRALLRAPTGVRYTCELLTFDPEAAPVPFYTACTEYIKRHGLQWTEESRKEHEITVTLPEIMLSPSHLCDLYHPEQLPGDYVVDLFRNTFVEENGEPFFDAIPFVCLPGSDAEAVNAEIQTRCRYAPDMNQRDGEWNYRWYVTGNVLTLIVSYDFFGAQISYKIYSFDLKNYKRLTQEDILTLAGVSREDFEYAVPILAANACFENMNNDVFRHHLEDPEHRFELAYMFEATTGELLEHVTPYLNKTGELCFTTIIATPVGSERNGILLVYDPHVVPSPYYEICLEYLEEH